MIIKNALIYTSEHTFKIGNLAIHNERISPNTFDSEIIDADGLYAFPGLVDIHFHGAAGCDFCDASFVSMQKIADYEATHGILAICPATMTYPKEKLYSIMEYAAKCKLKSGADLIGINLEGPFISKYNSGAHNSLFTKKCNIEMFNLLMEKSGNLIKLVSVAPEEPYAIDFIHRVHSDVRVSIAHTCADYDTAFAAFDAGAKHVTHLYNAMPGIHHRNPGPVIAALESGADVELIADGIHVHPAIVRLTFNTFGADKVIMVSDSIMATGLETGSYSLGGQKVSVAGQKAVLTEHPDVIAGSVTNLYECVKCAVLNMGIPLETAIRAASENPAKAIGAAPDYGSLAVGAYGNVILADKSLNIKKIIQKGKIIVDA